MRCKTRSNGPRSVSARAATREALGRRASLGSQESMRSSARLLCGAPAGHMLTSSPRPVARDHDPSIGERHARARAEQKLSERMSLRRLLPARRRRQHLGWNFRPERAGPPRWASGLSECARRRAGAHPRLRQQSLEAAWRGGEQGRENGWGPRVTLP